METCECLKEPICPSEHSLERLNREAHGHSTRCLGRRGHNCYTDTTDLIRSLRAENAKLKLSPMPSQRLVEAANAALRCFDSAFPSSPIAEALRSALAAEATADRLTKEEREAQEKIRDAIGRGYGYMREVLTVHQALDRLAPALPQEKPTDWMAKIAEVAKEHEYARKIEDAIRVGAITLHDGSVKVECHVCGMKYGNVGCLDVPHTATCPLRCPSDTMES